MTNQAITTPAGGPAAPVQRRPMSNWIVAGISTVIGIALLLVVDSMSMDYAYLAAYTVLQFVVMASAFNILAGYGGYINFGSAGFFGIGVYTSVVVYKALAAPFYVTIPCCMLVGGLLGFGTGYLTLRLRGIFFAIATLALAVVLNTLMINWDYVGGARGVYVLRPSEVPLIGSYTRYLFIVMLAMAIASVLIARAVENSWLGRGLQAIKDDETAAECAGIPSLRIKLIATTLTGAMMGAAGAPFPYFVTYVDPATAFNLSIAVNTLAMPLIGGLGTWIGPVIGAVLLGSLQQIATVTISSAANLLIVGVLLMLFIVVAPQGIVGLVRGIRERRK
jgi:branched-chain amino acid transport system permease protein